MSFDSGLVVATAMFASVPIYLVLQIWFGLGWRGCWRIAALLPLIAMLPALAWTVQATLRGENLAPMPAILAAMPSLLYLVILSVLRRLTHSAPDSEA
jgi:hypothetical protein